MLSLLALGHGFQVRLIGQVAQAHTGRPDEAPEAETETGTATAEAVTGVTPALVAAIAGRLAPAAEGWLGADPDQVVVSLHRRPGWGSVELTGQGEQRRLRVSLPADWLARVWAAGLALTGRHLVVAVERAGWPDARVLALRGPGTEPVLLHVRPVRSHGERAQAAGVGPDEARAWVRAADAEINDDLVPAGLDLPGRPVLPRDLRAWPWSATPPAA